MAWHAVRAASAVAFAESVAGQGDADQAAVQRHVKCGDEHWVGFRVVVGVDVDAEHPCRHLWFVSVHCVSFAC